MGRRSAKIIPLPIRQRLVCSVCGADGEGTCRCGAPYVPAGQRAAEAVAANPERSDRVIAEEIGVGSNTVRRARKATGNQLPVGDTAAPDGAADEATGDHPPVERRTGKDGKTYPAKVKRKVPTHVYNDAAARNGERWRYSLMIYAGETISMTAAWSREFGRWGRFTATSDLITLAEQAAATWQQLANDLKKRRN